MEKITSPIVVISALTRQALDKLLNVILEEMKKAPKVIETLDEEVKNYTFEDTKPPFIITKTQEGFSLTGDALKVLFERTDFTKDEGVKRFARQLRGMGVDEALRKAGAKNKDTINIFDFEFEFIE